MEEPVSSPERTEQPRGPWLGLGIGFLIIVAIIGWLVYSSRTSETRSTAHPTVMEAAISADPYAARESG